MNREIKRTVVCVFIKPENRKDDDFICPEHLGNYEIVTMDQRLPVDGGSLHFDGNIFGCDF